MKKYQIIARILNDTNETYLVDFNPLGGIGTWSFIKNEAKILGVDIAANWILELKKRGIDAIAVLEVEEIVG